VTEERESFHKLKGSRGRGEGQNWLEGPTRLLTRVFREDGKLKKGTKKASNLQIENMELKEARSVMKKDRAKGLDVGEKAL